MPTPTAADGPRSPGGSEMFAIVRDAMTNQPDQWTVETVSGLFEARGMTVDIATCWGLLRHFTVVAPVVPPTERGVLFDLPAAGVAL